MEQNMTAAMPEMGGSKQQGNGLKIATAIASVIAVCGIGFGVYGMVQSSQKDNQISDLKVQIKNEDGTVTTIETPKIEATTSDGIVVTITDSITKMVRTVVDEKKTFPWPANIERLDYEPETLINEVTIPEITIDSQVAQSINNRINERYTIYLEDDQNYSKGPYDVKVGYDSIIRDDILYIIIRTIISSYRATGSSGYDVYYYDIKGDRELSVQDIVSKYQIPHTNATKVIPSVLDSFDVYYRDENYCYALGCEVIENYK